MSEHRGLRFTYSRNGVERHMPTAMAAVVWVALFAFGPAVWLIGWVAIVVWIGGL